MKVSEKDINRALEMMAEHFPADRRDIWCKDNGIGELAYTAYLGSNDAIGVGSESGWGHTAVEAVECLIKRAGERDPAVLRQKHIAKLRRELAELEAQEIAPEVATSETV